MPAYAPHAKNASPRTRTSANSRTRRALPARANGSGSHEGRGRRRLLKQGRQRRSGVLGRRRRRRTLQARLRRLDAARPAAPGLLEIRELVPDLLQLARELRRGGVTLGGILREAALDRPTQGRRHAGVEALERQRLVLDDRGQRLNGSRAVEETPARQHLVDDERGRELVGAEIERALGRLLGRHVAGRSDDQAHLREPRVQLRRSALQRFLQLRQPEVQDLHETVLRDHDVLGLQVPVHDAGLVRLGEPARDLGRDFEGLLDGERAGFQQLPQRPAVDQLHGQVRRGLRLADLEDRDDVGMIQRGRGARLEREAREPFLILEELLRQHLQRDLAAEPRVERAVDLSHPAHTEPVDDLEGTEHGSGLERNTRIGVGEGFPSQRGRQSGCGARAARSVHLHAASPGAVGAEPRRSWPSRMGLTCRNGRKCGATSRWTVSNCGGVVYPGHPQPRVQKNVSRKGNDSLPLSLSRETATGITPSLV